MRRIRCLRAIHVFRRPLSTSLPSIPLSVPISTPTTTNSSPQNNRHPSTTLSPSAVTHRLPELTAQQLPLLVTLHARLNLPKAYSLSTLLQALNYHNLSSGLASNFALNILGKNLLSYHVLEHLLLRYPRLPMPVHNAAVDAYMGDDTLAQIAQLWAIQLDTSSKVDKHLANEPEFMQYGRLRYCSDLDKLQPVQDGIVKVGSAHDPATIAKVYALLVRSIVGGMYTHCGENSAKEFINRHVLLRKVALREMFEFSQPTRELVRVCDKLGFTDPVEIRLTAETGRLLAHPIYAATAFCGVQPLGDGIGSLIQEAKTRLVVLALLAYYLYSPVSAEGGPILVPSDENYQFEGIIGSGDVAI